MNKNTICLWYDSGAQEAAEFYAATFPDSAVSAVHTAPADFPSGKKGDVLTVDFTVCGVPCMGLNGGPASSYRIWISSGSSRISTPAAQPGRPPCACAAMFASTSSAATTQS